MYQMSQSGLEALTSSAPIYGSAPSYSPPPMYSASGISAPVYHVMAQPKMELEYGTTAASSLYKSVEQTYSPIPMQQEYHFIPDNFLKPGKSGKFVGEATEIQDYIEDTFEKMFNQPFPEDIKISLLPEDKFRKLAPLGVVGLSLNRRQQGLMSEIFVLQGTLGNVLLTVGHEIGHVLTSTLSNPHDEEAKAYAFSLAWLKVIEENNIAGLENALISEIPANNGLHNVAFDFVSAILSRGITAWQAYKDLRMGALSLAHAG